jgi:hypothetical protein
MEVTCGLHDTRCRKILREKNPGFSLDFCSKDVSGFMGKAICENGGVLVVLGHRISTNRPDNQPGEWVVESLNCELFFEENGLWNPTVGMENACSELGSAMELILDMAEKLKSR